MYACPDCGDLLNCARDPGEHAEWWCDNQRSCEQLNCTVHTCDEEKRPRPCDMCGMNFCEDHLYRVADGDFCNHCAHELGQRIMEGRE